MAEARPKRRSHVQQSGPFHWVTQRRIARQTSSVAAEAKNQKATEGIPNRGLLRQTAMHNAARRGQGEAAAVYGSNDGAATDKE